MLAWAAPSPGPKRRRPSSVVAAEEGLGAGGGGGDGEASFPPAHREGGRERARCSVGIRSTVAADDTPRRVAGLPRSLPAAPSRPAARIAATDTRLRTPTLSRHFGVPRAVLEC
jgi:hypothetical protein